MTGITDLAVETRLQISEYLLQFKHSLKKIKSAKKPNKTRPFRALNHTGKLYNRTNATALLFVNRQFHVEALATLYKLNTIVLKHVDICGGAPDKPVCDLSLVHRAVLNDPLLWSEHEPCWSGCDTSLRELVDFLNSEDFPRLRSVTINITRRDSIEALRKELRGPNDPDDEEDLESDSEETAPLSKPARSAGEAAWAEHAERKRQQAKEEDARAVERDLREYLRETRIPDMELKFTSVGECKIVGKGVQIKPEITLRFPYIIKTWQYYQSLSWDNHDLCPTCVPRPGVLADVPDGLWIFVQALFVSRAMWQEHAMDCAHAAEVGMEISVGRWMVNVKDFSLGRGDEVLWGRIMEAAMDEM